MAVDYAAAVNIRSDLQAAVDSAALSVALDASQTLSSSSSTSITAANYRPRATAAVQAMMAKHDGATVDEIHVCTTTNGDCAATNGTKLTNGQVYVRATGSSPRFLTKVLETASTATSSSVTIGAEAVASALGTSSSYVDIYLLVDISASMGLGASAADQTKMTNAMGCAFACHNQNPWQTNSTANDTVLYAHSIGATLRIDAMKSALKTVIDKAVAANGSATTPKIRFAVYTFANTFKQVLPISSNYGTTTSTGTDTIYGAINSLDIARYNAGTNLPGALKQMAAIVPTSGDGSSQSSAKTFVFLASDGVADTMDNPSTGGSFVVEKDWINWNPTTTTATKWANWVNTTNQYSTNSIAINSGVACSNYLALENSASMTDTTKLQSLFGGLPPCVSQPYSSQYYSTEAGKSYISQFEELIVMPIDPTWCSVVKAKMTNLMTLYTTYLSPPPPQQPYVNYTTYAVVPKLVANMKSCASDPKYAFTASDTATISTQIQKMFALATAETSKIRLAK